MNTNILLCAFLAVVAMPLSGDVRTYVNLRKKPVTLAIRLSNDVATKRLDIPGESQATLETGGGTVESVVVSGPDRRIDSIERSFTFDKNYKSKYGNILNTPDKINFIDNDENPLRSRPFRFMEQSSADERKEIAQKMSDFSDSAKKTLEKAAEKVGAAASWIVDTLKSIGQTTAGIDAVSR